MPRSSRSWPPLRLRHYRVTLGDVLQAHKEALKHGGRDGILDLGRIKAAIGRPYTGYYKPLSAKCAALLQSLVRNHGFVDGNKRTALLAVDLLIDRNGYALRSAGGATGDEFEELILRVANEDLPFEEIHRWFRLRLRKAMSVTVRSSQVPR